MLDGDNPSRKLVTVETMVMSSEWDSLKGSDIPSRKKNLG